MRLSLTANVTQADKVATGHNADDIAETVLLNILRGDLPRLSRCAAIITGLLTVDSPSVSMFPDVLLLSQVCSFIINFADSTCAAIIAGLLLLLRTVKFAVWSLRSVCLPRCFHL